MPTVTLDDVTLNYRCDGPDDAPAILLSNSLASNLAMWEPQVPALLQAGYRVIRYDSRGHGATSVPEGPYTMDMLAGDAVGLLDHLGVERACVMGCSMGGMVAQRLAATRGDRIRAAVLTATSCNMSGAVDTWNERIAAVRDQGMAAVTDATIDRWFVPDSQSAIADQVAAVRAGVEATPAAGFCGSAAAIRDMDQREMITGITVPTLVVVGEKDPGTPPSAAREIHERIPGSTLLEIPNAAHFVHMEYPDRFNEAMLGLLREAG